MVDLAVAEAGARGGVAFFEQFSNEGQAAFSRLPSDEADELVTGEVARMCGDKVEETGFVLTSVSPRGSLRKICAKSYPRQMCAI